MTRVSEELTISGPRPALDRSNRFVSSPFWKWVGRQGRVGKWLQNRVARKLLLAMVVERSKCAWR